MKVSTWPVVWELPIPSPDFEKSPKYIGVHIMERVLIEVWKLDHLIQDAMKRILNLLSWVSRDWLHHCHGAKILDLIIKTNTSRKKVSQKMRTSLDIITQYTGNQIDPRNWGWLRQIHIDNTSKFKCNVQQQREKGYTNKITDILSTQHLKERQWETGSRKIGDKVRTIQGSPFTLPTKVNKTRINNDVNLRHCKVKKP